MTYTGPFTYTLQLSGEDKRTLLKKDALGKPTRFTKVVNQSRVPKIYVLQQDKELVYIGYASQGIGTRLGQGLRANGNNGYHGYKWKTVHQLKLHVFVFNQTLEGNKHNSNQPYIKLAEAVEAELVYLVRSKTGSWPKYQNEIHFNNEYLSKAKEVAAEMYNLLIP